METIQPIHGSRLPRVVQSNGAENSATGTFHRKDRDYART